MPFYAPLTVLLLTMHSDTMSCLYIHFFLSKKIFQEHQINEHISHAGHTRKASRIRKTVVENCGKGVGNF